MMDDFDPAYSLAGFVAGATNQLAVAAARALAEAARPPFNPLYVQGGPGQGKTHLLQAIGALRLSIDPRVAVRYVPWEQFASALRPVPPIGPAGEFLSRLEEADLILLDDVHRLRDQPWCREGLLALLDARVAQRRSTALAAGVGPDELLGPDDPAARLLGGGLVVEIGSPDATMREEMIRRRAAEAGVAFSNAVVTEVVHLPFESARDLVGAVSRLVAFQAVSPAPLDPSQARVLITGVLDEDTAGSLTGVPWVTGAEPSAPPTPAAPAVPPASSAASAPGIAIGGSENDEFGSFLSEVVAGISAQVDRWRARVGDAILRWEAEGFHTARLHALLDQELPAQPEKVLERFEGDLSTLRGLVAEVAELAPDLAGHEALRDPDQLAVAEQLLVQARARGLAGHAPAPHLRLEDVVEGPSNRAALQAIKEALGGPGHALNPLVVVGESGCGKSHLLHGLGNALQAAGIPGVACLGAQVLTTEVEETLQQGRLAPWRRRFQWVGALLVDDVHLLAGHPTVQDVLLELLDQMLTDHRQTAFTSALPLADLGGLAPQLLARLAVGPGFELGRPDRELRRGIIRQTLAAAEGGDDAALIDHLAERAVDSVRALQVLIQRLIRVAESRRVRLSTALAREVLEGQPRTGGRAGVKPGVLGPTVGGPRLREKLVEVWPAARERLIEELR